MPHANSGREIGDRNRAARRGPKRPKKDIDEAIATAEKHSECTAQV